MVLLISTLAPYQPAMDLSWLYRPGLVFLKRYREACWGCKRSSSPPTVLIPHPRTSQLTVSVWGGGGIGVRGWATTPPRHKLEG